MSFQVFRVVPSALIDACAHCTRPTCAGRYEGHSSRLMVTAMMTMTSVRRRLSTNWIACQRSCSCQFQVFVAIHCSSQTMAAANRWAAFDLYANIRTQKQYYFIELCSVLEGRICCDNLKVRLAITWRVEKIRSCV